MDSISPSQSEWMAGQSHNHIHLAGHDSHPGPGNPELLLGTGLGALKPEWTG